MEEVLLVSSKSDSLSSLPDDEEDCDSFWNSSLKGEKKIQKYVIKKKYVLNQVLKIVIT